jgi:hypothetical protein
MTVAVRHMPLLRPGLLAVLGLSLAACAAAGGAGRVPGQEVRVTGLGYADGAAARRQADAQCGARGVRTSVYDRFDAGTWIYPEGCA